MPKRPNPNLNAALNRLAAAETQFIGSEFAAPVLRGMGVGVRIGGVRCKLAVTPPDFEGWGVFKAVSFERAELLRNMKMGERQRYLELFPAVRMILCQRQKEEWLALPASLGDSRFSIEGLVPLRFATGDLFETVLSRFDGGQFWYDQTDDRADAAATALLRQSLLKLTEPEKVQRPGLTAEQRLAYLIAYRARLEEVLLEKQNQAETRLRAALEHAGASLRDYSEQPDTFRVSYQVDGQRHTSLVRKNHLSVVTAGICLSGGDRNFDLASLVGVLRQADESGRIVRQHW